MLGKIQVLFSKHWKTALAAVLLFVLTAWLFWPAVGYDFINFDDNVYVSENAYVRHGFSVETVKWAFTAVHENYWLPLTWLSYMADSHFCGTHASCYHRTNVLLHALNAALIFVFFSAATGKRWASLVVAGLFAAHPTRVESVAWITERKDVLSAFFWFLGMLAYLLHTRKPTVVRLGLVFLCMLLGLLAKPMLVTFPFVLLLLDFWPLSRAGMGRGDLRSHWPRLVAEKVPLLVLAVAFSALTYGTQALKQVPLHVRLLNVSRAYGFYIAKTFWPTDLAVVYPELRLDATASLLCWFILLAVTWAALRYSRRCRYLPVGWLWFTGTLVPVIGFVRVGTVHVADRFAYVPLVGLFVAVVWGACDALGVMGRGRWLSAGGAAVGLVASAVLAQNQLATWRDTETLFRQALKVDPSNCISYEGLGRAMEDQGRLDEALACYEKTVSLLPEYGEAYANIGNIYGKKGEFARAIEYFEVAVKYAPQHAKIRNNLGSLLYRAGRQEEAIDQIEQALRLNPQLLDARFNLGLALLKSGRQDDALIQLLDVARRNRWDSAARYLAGTIFLARDEAESAVRILDAAVRLKPDDPEYLNSLGVAWLKAGRWNEALKTFASICRLQPDNAESLNNLAWLLAVREGMDASEAVRLARRAAELTNHRNPRVLDTLAAAHAAAGEFGDALGVVDAAILLASEQGLADSVETMMRRRSRYAAGLPWRE